MRRMCAVLAAAAATITFLAAGGTGVTSAQSNGRAAAVARPSPMNQRLWPQAAANNNSRRPSPVMTGTVVNRPSVRAHAPHFYIPAEHRVRVPGACFWECVESVGRTRGHAGLHGIAAHKKKTTDGGARQDAVKQALDEKKIPYLSSPYGSFDYEGLKKHAHMGVIVGIQTRRHNPTPTSGHAIVVVAANDSKVTFWDPSAPDRIGTVDRHEFVTDWFGDGLVIMPK